MKKKSIILSEDTHMKIKTYCNKNYIKINEWVNHILSEYIDKLEGNNGKNTTESNK